MILPISVAFELMVGHVTVTGSCAFPSLFAVPVIVTGWLSKILALSVRFTVPEASIWFPVIVTSVRLYTSST